MDHNLIDGLDSELECEEMIRQYHEILGELRRIRSIENAVRSASQRRLAEMEILLRASSVALIRELSYHLAPTELSELGSWMIDEGEKEQTPEERWAEHRGRLS